MAIPPTGTYAEQMAAAMSPYGLRSNTPVPAAASPAAAAPAAKRGFLDFGLTDAERDAQLQRTIAINNQEMARLQAKRAAEQAAVNQPIQGPPIPPRMPAPMMGPSYPYQIPNRNFTWQTTPQEQMALAGRMNRQDLQPLLGSGEYGPLAGQQYRYTPQGTTQINYGPGGGSGFGGYVWPGGLLGGGVVDAGVIDTGVVDTGVTDTGVVDTGVVDTGVVDTGGTTDIRDRFKDRRTEGQRLFDQRMMGRDATVADIGITRRDPRTGQTITSTGLGGDYRTSYSPYGAEERGQGAARGTWNVDDPASLAARQAANLAAGGTLPQSRIGGTDYQQFDTGAEEATTYPFATTAGRIEGEVARSQAQRQALGDQQRQAEMQRRVVQSQREQEARVRADEFASAQRAADQRAAAQAQRDALTQSQQREESRGREAQEERVVQAQAKETRQKIKAQQERSAKRAQEASRKAAAKRTASRQAAADRSAKAAQAKRIEQQRKTREQAIQGQAAATKTMLQARARARNKEAEKKKAKRAAEAKKKGYRIGPSGRK